MCRILSTLTVSVFVLAPSALCVATESTAATPSATQVLRDVVATYGTMTSYRDRGISITKRTSEGQFSETRRKFEMLFERPGKLRFAWDEEWSGKSGKYHSVIWSDGTSSWSSYGYMHNKREMEKDLGRAVAGATGITAGAAHNITRLLANEIGGVRMDELEDWRVTGEESIDSVECVRLTGHYPDGSQVNLWIGRKDNLIRKVITGGTGTETVETRMGIVVNDDIDNSAFKE